MSGHHPNYNNYHNYHPHHHQLQQQQQNPHNVHQRQNEDLIGVGGGGFFQQQQNNNIHNNHQYHPYNFQQQQQQQQQHNNQFNPQNNNNGNNNSNNMNSSHNMIDNNNQSNNHNSANSRQSLTWTRIDTGPTTTATTAAGSSSSSSSGGGRGGMMVVGGGGGGYGTSATGSISGAGQQQQTINIIQPPPRSGAASVVLNNKLYMFGGYGGGTGRLDDFYSYDFDLNIWEEVLVLSEQKPGCRENNGVVIGDPKNGLIYLFGGYNGTLWLNDLWMFNIHTSKWICIQESSDPEPDDDDGNDEQNINEEQQIIDNNVDAALGDHPNNHLGGIGRFNNNNNPNVAAAAGGGDGDAGGENSIIVNPLRSGRTGSSYRRLAGQRTGVMENGGTGTISIGNNNNNGIVHGKVPSRRFGYVSVVHDNKFILFGGFDGSKWLNDMYEFNFVNNTWTKIIQPTGFVVPSVRSCPAWSKDNNYVYIHGGYDGVERKDDFFACNLSTYIWHEMPSLGTIKPSSRYFHSCCLYGSNTNNNINTNTTTSSGGSSTTNCGVKMYLYGGYSGSERLSDMYVYDFDTNYWSEVDCSNGDKPSGRSSLVAQVYENCLYIFGGYNGITVLNDFYKFRLRPVSIPPPLLVNDLRCLINNIDFADVVFLLEGNKKVYANKSILAVRSEYFKILLFSGGMKESCCSSGGGRQTTTSASATTRDTTTSSSHNCNNTSGIKRRSSNDNYNYHHQQQQQHQGPSSSSTEAEEEEKESSSLSTGSQSPQNGSSSFDDHNNLQPIEIQDVSYTVFLKVLEYLYTDTVRFDDYSNNHNNYNNIYHHHAPSGGGGIEGNTSTNNTSTGSKKKKDGHHHNDSRNDNSSRIASSNNNNEALSLLHASSLDVGIHLLITSERFMLDRLKSLCEDYIRKEIHVNNVIHILIAAHRHNALGLKDIALEYILQNLNVPEISIGLSDLKLEPDLLVEIIKRNSTALLSSTSSSSSAAGMVTSASSSSQPNNNNNNNISSQQQHQHHPAGPFGR